jgi:hypothetical protein
LLENRLTAFVGDDRGAEFPFDLRNIKPLRIVFPPWDTLPEMTAPVSGPPFLTSFSCMLLLLIRLLIDKARVEKKKKSGKAGFFPSN